ncbi:hypothetical protein NC651_009116 [Populus alba x Populus x berolinensis]|nr:hypothetical protein NC651_009116 [Populus alba x Populus x berolinensis]
MECVTREDVGERRILKQTVGEVECIVFEMSHVIGCMETKEDIVNEHHHCANSKSFKSLSTQRSH